MYLHSLLYFNCPNIRFSFFSFFYLHCFIACFFCDVFFHIFSCLIHFLLASLSYQIFHKSNFLMKMSYVVRFVTYPCFFNPCQANMKKSSKKKRHWLGVTTVRLEFSYWTISFSCSIH